MANVVRYKNTTFEYIPGRKSALFSNGILLPIEEFHKLDAEGSVVAEITKRWHSGQTLYDFRHAVTTGTLREVRKAQRKVRLKAPSVVSIVEFVMSAVALGSAVMSVYHTTVFMLTSGKPFWVSSLTGLIMILFSATAFSAARFFLTEKKPSFLYGMLFILLGVGVVSFSMFSTIAVNYEQYKGEEVTIQSSFEHERAKEERDTLKDELDRLDAQISRITEQADGWRNQSWARYDALQSRADELQDTRNVLWSEYTKVSASEVTTRGEAVKQSASIYSFTSRILRIGEELLRFIIYIIPAIFYDIASPFGFTVILMLEERRRVNGKTN